MDLGLRGKRVLVTGASSNIGRATAIVFGGEGARVAVGYHTNEAGAKETAAQIEQLGGEAVTVQIDLGTEESVERAAQETKAALGGVDVLINNAVSWGELPQPGEVFETVPVERMRKSLEANLFGQYLLARAVVGSMRERNWGRIVFISTGLVEDGNAGGATYLTPKSGLHGLTRTMSRELAASGILTNLVMPGVVVSPNRPFTPERLERVSAAAAIDRTTEATEVANIIAFLCSEANGAVTGELIRADGHFLTPRIPSRK